VAAKTPSRSSTKTAKQTCRTNPIPASIKKVKGFPDKLIIYKCIGSRFWYTRYYSSVFKKVKTRTTKTENEREAVEIAKSFFNEILLLEKEQPVPPHLAAKNSPYAATSIKVLAQTLIAEQQRLVDRGERSPLINRDNRQVLKDVIPFFEKRTLQITEITYTHIQEYVDKLFDRGLAPSSVKIHLNVIRKLFNIALRERLILQVTPFPKVKLKDNPRPDFTGDEYNTLKKVAKECAKEKVITRGNVITDELRLLITFAVNTFLRPSEIKALKHQHIEVNEGQKTYLKIQLEKTKTTNRPSVTMEVAVPIYKDICALHRKRGLPVSKNDYVFMPHLQNRSYALRVLSLQFDYLLNRAELKKTSTGTKHTLYSLRHTAIMFRLNLGDNINLLTLAKNARTSVLMIDRFYGSHHLGDRIVEEIQSIKSKVANKPKASQKDK
jgi:site-specific recombinase XerD